MQEPVQFPGEKYLFLLIISMTFRLPPSYGLTTGHEANEWFIDMMRDHEEFEVETDEPREPPLSFSSETVLGVMVE